MQNPYPRALTPNIKNENKRKLKVAKNNLRKIRNKK